MTTLVARAAITKDHRLNGLNSRNLFSHSSGGLKSKIKVSAFLRSRCQISAEACLLHLQMAIVLLCPHVTFPLCVHGRGVWMGEGERKRGKEREISSLFLFL